MIFVFFEWSCWAAWIKNARTDFFFFQSSPIKKQTSIAGINTTIKIKHLFKIQRFKTDNKNKIPICNH